MIFETIFELSAYSDRLPRPLHFAGYGWCVMPPNWQWSSPESGSVNRYHRQMAVCSFCDSEMNGSVGCVEVPVRIKAGVFAPIPCLSTETTEHSVAERCHDCDALPGRYHHRGCDAEECPNCHAQLISFRQTPAASLDLWTENHFCNRLPVFTVDKILRGLEVPAWVVHDDEGDWQVSGEDGFGDPVLSAVAFVTDVSDLHPSLAEVIDLPVGWEAWLDDATGTWKRGPFDVAGQS